MDTREVPAAQWRDFAESFTREHRGDRVTLFSERRSGARDEIARAVEFRALAVDTEIGQQSVVVTVDTDGERHLSHTISKPVSITTDESGVHVRSELRTGFTIELGFHKEDIMSETLRDWGFDPDTFQAKAKQSIESTKGDLSEITGVLREVIGKTKQTLLDLQTNREPVLDELRNGFERAWDEIEAAFARARKRVRESQKAPADDWLG
jgi:hypothetical protein